MNIITKLIDLNIGKIKIESKQNEAFEIQKKTERKNIRMAFK